MNISLHITRSLSTSLIVLVLSSCSSVDSTKDEQEQTVRSTQFLKKESKHTGIAFRNQITDNALQNVLLYEYFHNGGGVAIGDINNDGLNDIYFTANMRPNALYLNKGDFKFEDIAPSSGTGGKMGWTTGCTMADVNGDGWLDIYVCRSGNLDPDERRNLLFINQKNNTFQEMGKQYGLDDSGYSTQAIFLDIDQDNDLDMFLLNHPIKAGRKKAKDAQFDYDANTADRLYRNDNGKFKDISKEAGIIQNVLGYGLGVVASDFDHNGYPDLYVCNDYIEHDYLYMNQGNGVFVDMHETMLRHTSNFSMGVDAADVDNDLRSDFFVADMVAADNYRIKTNMSGMNPEKFNAAIENGFHYQYMYNTLQLNAGPEGFSEVAKYAGVSSTDWSWAPLWADFDLDGNVDLFVTNGLRKEARNNDWVVFKKEKLKEINASEGANNQEILKEVFDKMPAVPIQNFMFNNKGELQFEDVSDRWGFTEETFSNGAAYGDLDGDGDLDLVVNNIDLEASVYENATIGAHWLKVNLKGPDKNTMGIGSKVVVTDVASGQKQMKELYSTRGYQSAVEQSLVFGFSQEPAKITVDVYWPDAHAQRLELSESNQSIQIEYNKEQASIGSFTDLLEKKTIFNKDASISIDYVHKENDFDDFSREVLLPHKLSQHGPAMAVGDVNGDGLDDLFFGGAKGFKRYLYLQQSTEPYFKAVPISKSYMSKEDVHATFFDADNDGDIDLYVVTGGNEGEEGSKAQQDDFYRNVDGALVLENKAIPETAKSGSRSIPVDYDQDGDMDLFVGTRQVPGKYPISGSSYLLKNEDGQFALDDALPHNGELGMVTDAAVLDYNKDGALDLLVVGEWMKPTLLVNKSDSFSIQEVPEFTGKEGWWNSVEVADLNGDGFQDIICGNLGLNYKYKASAEEPFELYAGDLDANGTLDIVLGYYQGGNLFPLRGRECSSQQIPSIKKKFPSYDLFGKASLADVYDAQALDTALHLMASTFAHTAWLSTGETEKMDVIELPYRVQLSSINAFHLADFNEDGSLNIVAGGNLYQAEVETPRADAGRGEFIKWQGQEFSALANYESGLNFKGEIRALEGIKVGNQKYLLAIPNNGKPEFYKY